MLLGYEDDKRMETNRVEVRHKLGSDRNCSADEFDDNEASRIRKGETSSTRGQWVQRGAGLAN